MIRWPWTSRARLDDALEQVAFLRAENAQLTDTVTRMVRLEHGTTEMPRPPRAAPEQMPRELFEHIKGYGNRSIQKAMLEQAYRRRAAGESWDVIQADAMKHPEEAPE